MYTYAYTYAPTLQIIFSSLPFLVLALLVRNGTELRPLRADDGYDFNYQQYQWFDEHTYTGNLT